MGILYRETVINKHRGFFKFAIGFTILIFSVDVLMLISNPREFLKEIAYIGYVLLPIAVFVSAIVWHKCKIRYKYSIIDNELIIEKLNGDRRRLELNLNVKHIVAIEKGVRNKQGIEKEYDFTCGVKRQYAYRCLFNRGGKLYSFYFEPSNTLVNRINAAINRKMVS